VNTVKLFSVFFAVFFFGCATVPKPTANEAMSADELRLCLAQTTDSLKDFSAEGSITIHTPTMDQSAGFDLAARGTDSIKMSVYGPFGITVGSALFTRHEFTAYNALNNTVYRGSPEKQMRMLPFVKEIPFELLTGTLRGIYFFLQSSPIDSLSVNAENSLSFTISNSDGSFDKLQYDGGVNRITRCTRRDAGGSILWHVGYRYKRNVDGGIVPEQVEVNVPLKESTLVLDYDSVVWGSPRSPLTILFPEDAEIVTIE